jgi:hypothetical protein
MMEPAAEETPSRLLDNSLNMSEMNDAGTGAVGPVVDDSGKLNNSQGKVSNSDRSAGQEHGALIDQENNDMEQSLEEAFSVSKSAMAVVLNNYQEMELDQYGLTPTHSGDEFDAFDRSSDSDFIPSDGFGSDSEADEGIRSSTPNPHLQGLNHTLNTIQDGCLPNDRRETPPPSKDKESTSFRELNDDGLRVSLVEVPPWKGLILQSNRQTSKKDRRSCKKGVM